MTAFDISTASFTQTKSISGQSTSPYKIRFNSNGTKAFVLDYPNDAVDEFSLSSAFDISTLSYTTTKAHGSEGSPTGMTFKSDGTKLYILGFGKDTVFQFPLSTAWDISTLGATEKNISITTQDNAPYGVDFANNGTKMYVHGSQNNAVFQYTLSTAWDVSTATYDNKSFSLAGYSGTTPLSITFNLDGTKAHISTNVDDIFQFTVGTPYDISTLDYEDIVLNVSAKEDSTRGHTFNPDGTKLFIVGSASDSVHEYSLPSSGVWGGKVNGILYSNIAKINGVARANISKINGIDVT